MNGRAVWALSTVAVLGSTWVARSARADPAGDAMDSFARGRDLRAHGDCADAVPLFRAAHDAYPAGLGSLRNIAECRETLGLYSAALAAWLDLQRALLATSSARYDGWAQDADSATVRLAQKVATLAVGLTVVNSSGAPTSGARVTVTLNDMPLAASALGTTVDMDPGRYVVRALGPNQELLDQRTVDLEAGTTKRLDLHVVLSSAAPAAFAPEAAQGADRSERARRAAGWISVGLGGASLAGAGISLAVFESASARLDQRCPNYRTQPCDPSLRSTVHEGDVAGTLVDVLALAGLVVVAGGVGILSWQAATHNAQASLVISPTGISAAGKFW
jgi:hypothetical protein